VDLSVPPHTSPGNYPIRVGFSHDDVIYLLMPDRFANGDASNDDPPVSRGMYDRTKPRSYHGRDFRGIIQHLP
jgi:hypothetical protein